MLTITGTLPSAMREGSRAGDWVGTLALSSNRGAITSVEATGPGAMNLALAWNVATGLLTIRPGAPVDYEAFAAVGADAEIAFSLRATLASGRTEVGAAVFRVAVLDADDTPPNALRFDTGGGVTAGAIGAVIGTLAVADPDTPADGPFVFTFAEEDAWRFEVVGGNTLKLRDGISLGLDDMPSRPVLVSVSDGQQSAAFALDLTVTDPGAPPPIPLTPEVGEMHGAVGLAAPDRAVALAPGSALAAFAPPDGGDPSGPRLLGLVGAPDAWLPATVARLDFADGRLELDPAGTAARAAALHRALDGAAGGAGAVADGAALAHHVAALEDGAGLAARAAAALAARAAAAAAPAADDAAFVAELYRAAAGREPGSEELALQLARLGSGVSRAQVAVDVALAPVVAPDPKAEPEAHWVALPLGRDAPDAAAPHAAAPWSGWDLPAPPAFATDLLLG